MTIAFTPSVDLERLSDAERDELLALLEQRERDEAERVKREAHDALLADRDGTRHRCRTLAGFVREAWHVLEPNTRLIWGWHLDAMCDHLEAVTEGRINRLLINVPPGSSKSMIVSVLWPAWEWGPKGRRSLRYLTTSFADDSVKRDTRKHRDLVLSEWYQTLWPEVRLVRMAERSFSNADTGNREGVAFGSLTSKRGDRLIIDDPHSTKTAESAAERATTVRLFREGATNRLNDQERSAIVVVMQRLHENDVAGTILALKMGYVHLCLPMEFEPGRFEPTAIGFVDPRTADGDLLDPARFPRAVVDDLKRDLGSYAFAGQYQQRPAPRDGAMFKRAWFAEPVGACPINVTGRVRAWDLAASTGSKADWTVGVRMSRAPDGMFYVEHVERFRGTPAEVEKTILALARTDGVDCAIRLPQDPGQAGKAQAQTLTRLLAGFDVRATPVTGSKETRATPAAAQCEAGNVRLVAEGNWQEAFVHELCSFPAGAHDDQVDAFADALNELALGSMYDSTMSWV